MPRHSYSNEQLIEAVKNSISIRQTLNKLGLKEAGGNYKTVYTKIQSLNLDTSHFKRQGWKKGVKAGPKRPLSAYLLNEFSIGSSKLRERLLQEKVKSHKCECCKRTRWGGQKIPLELHHVNGNHTDNSLGNLQLLCPNCHALTENYRGKNISA